MRKKKEKRNHEDYDNWAHDNSNLQKEELQHNFVLTGKPNSNGKILRVRCTCMAEYKDVSTRYYNYDPLAEVTSIEDAKKAYADHLAKFEKPA